MCMYLFLKGKTFSDIQILRQKLLNGAVRLVVETFHCLYAKGLCTALFFVLSTFWCHMWSTDASFSSPEATLLLASTKNHDLWPNLIFWTHIEYSFCILSQSDYFVRFDRKSVNYGLPVLDQPRGHDSWCWPKVARPLGTRMHMHGCVKFWNHVSLVFTLWAGHEHDSVPLTDMYAKGHP